MTRTLVLWFGLCAAPLAWASQLVAGYALADALCSTGTSTDDLWGLDLDALVAILTVLAAGVAIAGGVAAWATWRAPERQEIADPRGRIAFLGFASLLASALFFAIIVLGGLQVVHLSDCSP